MNEAKVKGQRQSGWFSGQFSRTKGWTVAAVGILSVLGAVISRALTGGPYRVMMQLGIGNLIPPVWAVSSGCFLGFVLIGCAGGFVAGFSPCPVRADKARSLLLFFLLLVTEWLWYPLFFGAGAVFLALVTAILILCLSIAAAGEFFRFSALPGLAMLLHSVWLSYLLFLQFAVFFTV